MGARNADIEVLGAEVSFREVPFAAPLVLSSGPITGLTEAVAEVVVRNRRGTTERGTGSVLLSYPWAYGARAPRGEDRDAVLRSAVEQLAAELPDLGGPADPLRLGGSLTEAARRLASRQDLPMLAALVCAAPLDAAVHDGWGKALGEPVYQCYTAEHLGADLSHYLGPAFAGRFPGHYLRSTPLPRLPVQHVVGVGDPLTPDEAEGSAVPLTEWVVKDGVRCFKIKLSGKDPVADAARINDVHRVVATAPAPVRLSLDPNEGCPDPGRLAAVLHALAELNPVAREAVRYAEQPFPRESAGDLPGLPELTEQLPVLLDEALLDVAGLDALAAAGWSGVTVKTGRGHTQSLLAYCWARQHGRFVALADLTNVGAALLHSAAMASWLHCDAPAFECNSRQYSPAGNVGTAGALVVRGGELDLAPLPREGIR
ncbi:enolase C-terminal domain-like protein [Amycolatopsis taiwanensis]|uniref:Mandelate racemase/muconate lactonizing enzyme C-terminal domain-containing protein n=1 Tax=Amycolatopsis taiwanensis TaxID=342230 RepID=A0A9W6VLB2_9PSEU|nr:enolase C-terminal domain-like protein [Amycolatopsis taiwanensis]GLY70341.1 hypothetical protein Atai01_69600 [Amycolatopsis taiwanensis]